MPSPKLGQWCLLWNWEWQCQCQTKVSNVCLVHQCQSQNKVGNVCSEIDSGNVKAKPQSVILEWQCQGQNNVCLEFQFQAKTRSLTYASKLKLVLRGKVSRPKQEQIFLSKYQNLEWICKVKQCQHCLHTKTTVDCYTELEKVKLVKDGG